MDRKAFISLLQRYLDGTCSPKERQMLDAWYQLLDQDDQDLTDGLHQAELEERLWNKIQQEIQPDPIPLGAPERQLGWLGNTRMQWIAAASVLLIGGLVYYTLLNPILRQEGPLLLSGIYSNQHQEKNNDTASRWIILEDSSRVFLGPGSVLDYPVPFTEKQRIVHLTGSAFFEITKDTARPFLVYSGDIVTKVVGTSFSIRAGDNDLEVAVVTGKVIVEKARNETSESRLAGNEGVVLTPNQKVTYFSRNKYFVTGLVEAPVILSKPAMEKGEAVNFLFEETPLNDVLQKLETAYGLDILMANEELANCPITADLTTQPLYTKLNIICAALRASYEVKGTHILLTGGNCQ